ncbi:MAG: tripartite tricarboxylate transporter substrate binding protein [Betaproteobacteria bacterium]|nr:tripartite tricarboxylate transporter substrate binding protein [Betaproteobacteria bacterium]
MNPQRIAFALVTGTLLCVFFAQSAVAQAFPSKPLRIIVPFPPGGTTDVVARIIANRMTETMSQPVTVENRGGGGGTIGADAMAKAPPDGYTLLMANLTFPMGALASAHRLPYNIDTDFAGVSISVFVPTMVTAHPSVPATNLRELATLLQRDPSLKYAYVSTGPGSVGHVMYENFKRAANVDLTHIPFKGAAPAKQELIAGRIQVGGDQLSSSLAEIKNGTLRALATYGSKRVPVLPDVPTVRELGFPMLEADGWNGLFAPGKTPRDIVNRLSKEASAAARHPDSVKRLTELGAEPIGSTPEEQDAILKKYLVQFRLLTQHMKFE